MEKKMTRKEYFEKIRGFIPEDEVEMIEFIDKQIEMIDKKTESAKAKKSEDELSKKLKESALSILSKPPHPIMQASEIIAQEPIRSMVNEKGNPISTQKMSSVLNKMCEANEIQKKKEKNKTLFYI